MPACYHPNMQAELLKLRDDLIRALRNVNTLIAGEQELNPDHYIPANPVPELSRTLYRKIQENSAIIGLPVPTHAEIKTMLLAAGWTSRKTAAGLLLSPPPVSDLP